MIGCTYRPLVVGSRSPAVRHTAPPGDYPGASRSRPGAGLSDGSSVAVQWIGVEVAHGPPLALNVPAIVSVVVTVPDIARCIANCCTKPLQDVAIVVPPGGSAEVKCEVVISKTE